MEDIHEGRYMWNDTISVIQISQPKALRGIGVGTWGLAQ